MNDQELQALCNALAMEAAPNTKAMGTGNLASGILDVFNGLKAKGINFITIIQYLPVIISAIQTLGPKVQEIIELISNLIDNFKPQPVPPVVKP